jgi:hypothetical protein
MVRGVSFLTFAGSQDAEESGDGLENELQQLRHNFAKAGREKDTMQKCVMTIPTPAAAQQSCPHRTSKQQLPADSSLSILLSIMCQDIYFRRKQQGTGWSKARLRHAAQDCALEKTCSCLVNKCELTLLFWLSNNVTVCHLSPFAATARKWKRQLNRRRKCLSICGCRTRN